MVHARLADRAAGCLFYVEKLMLDIMRKLRDKCFNIPTMITGPINTQNLGEL